MQYSTMRSRARLHVSRCPLVPLHERAAAVTTADIRPHWGVACIGAKGTPE